MHVAGPCFKYIVSGVTLQVVTLEDVVEEIVGEIFDENDSKVCVLPDGVIAFALVSTYDLCDMLVAGVTITC